MAQDIKAILNRILPQSANWKRTLLEQWPTIIGNLHAHVQIEKIQNETLILGVTDSCWLQELYLLSDMLLQRINQNLEKPHIKKLRFKQSGSKSVRSYKTKPKRKIACKIVTLSKKEQTALSNITDPDLRHELEQFLIRCYQER